MKFLTATTVILLLAGASALADTASTTTGPSTSDGVNTIPQPTNPVFPYPQGNPNPPTSPSDSFPNNVPGSLPPGQPGTLGNPFGPSNNPNGGPTSPVNPGMPANPGTSSASPSGGGGAVGGGVGH